MRYKGVTLMAVALLTTFSYGEFAQQAPAPPEPPAAPQAEAPRYKEHRQVKVYLPGGSYLGVDPRDVTSDRATALKLNEARGVEVMMVDRDAPAGKAGVKEHDVITSFDGKPVANAEQLRRLLRESQPGKTVPLGISRDGQSMTLNAALAKRPQMEPGLPANFVFPKTPRIPDIDIPDIMVLEGSRRNGVMVEDLSQQLADFFGVKNGGGVLVRSVERGSVADAAGLKAGDVIVKVGDKPISCSSDWRRMMSGRHGNVQIGVIRDKREQGVTLKLPEESPDSSLHMQIPDFHAQMEELRAEMERQRPELEKELQIARADLEKQLQGHQKDLHEFLQQFRSSDFQKQMKDAQKALDEALKSWQME